MSPLAPGEIVLRDATRSFSVRADQARTFKGLLFGARADGPPPVPALQGVNLHIAPGETVGMVGRNGAGKTSTLRVLAGIVPLQSGEAQCGGRVVSLLELASGFSRDFSGRENIYLQGALYGFSKEELEARIERIIAFSELGEFIDIPVKTYSSGMFVRLGFSIAAHLDADVMLIDEVLAVGDEAFQRKCLRRISEQIAGGTTLVFVSHDAGAVERVCERVVVLDAGRIAFDGPTAEGLLHYHRLMGTEHGEGELLRGQHSAAVLDVELQDELGRRATVFPTGSPLTVALRLAEPQGLTLELRSGDGTLLHRAAIPPGGTELRYEIPALPLLGGDYDLTLGGRTVRFSVPDGGPAEGVLDLGGRWRSVVESRHEPEAALAAARRAAAEARAAGEYPPARPAGAPPATPEFSPAQLTEWALVEPDLREIRSTRPYGAPITALKRGLLRLLGQYHGQVLAQQARFNLHLLGQVRALEQRVAELERRLEGPEQRIDEPEQRIDEPER